MCVVAELHPAVNGITPSQTKTIIPNLYTTVYSVYTEGNLAHTSNGRGRKLNQGNIVMRDQEMSGQARRDCKEKEEHTIVCHLTSRTFHHQLFVWFYTRCFLSMLSLPPLRMPSEMAHAANTFQSLTHLFCSLSLCLKLCTGTALLKSHTFK